MSKNWNVAENPYEIHSVNPAATIKHFPDDGVDSRDPHLTTTCNSLSLQNWRSRHGRVFQELINGGVAAIMPGHITLPAYQQERINGFPPPATLRLRLGNDRGATVELKGASIRCSNAHSQVRQNLPLEGVIEIEQHESGRAFAAQSENLINRLGRR